MRQQLMFLCAAALVVVIGSSIDVIVADFPCLAPPMQVAPGALAGALFMAIMHDAGVAPATPAAAFAVPWAVAHILSSDTFGVRTVRDRVKRGALAAACGGLGVLATMTDG